MKINALAFVLSLFLVLPICADDTFATTKHGPRVVQDPTSKIVFYLESDQCHVSAISPEGKLLWSKNLFPYARLSPHIEKFAVSSGGNLQIEGTGGSYGSMVATLKGKTGEILLMSAL
jgi:hypothetical protein